MKQQLYKCIMALQTSNLVLLSWNECRD